MIILHKQSLVFNNSYIFEFKGCKQQQSALYSFLTENHSEGINRKWFHKIFE